MPENKTRLPFLGREIDATEVPIVNASEKISTYDLEDGAQLRVRTVVTAVMRVDNEWDGDGNPMYVLKTSVVLTPMNVPANLRRPKS